MSSSGQPCVLITIPIRQDYGDRKARGALLRELGPSLGTQQVRLTS